MPELPEVETIRRDLEKYTLGKRIKEVIINNPKIIKEPKPQEFKKRVEGLTIKNISRKAKVLILELSSKDYVVIHLRLTGVLTYGEKKTEARVSFLLSDNKYLNLSDQRMLGEIRLVKDWKELKFIKELGPEPFQISLEEFKEMIKKKKMKIKSLLMDQKFISGVGNVYAAESLFRAGIHPLRLASSLKDEEINLLFEEIKNVLVEAIKFRGSSVDTYRDLSGEKGKFEDKLQVYGRENKPCLKCKTPIRRISLGGRGTYFCPKCQR
jgi:formamidopyrimidine-DNA glycosylase